MLNQQAIKALEKQFGSKVAELRATFAVEASKAQAVKDEFMKLINERGLPNTQLKSISGVGPVITQTIEHGEEASTAIRIVAYGNDLLLEMYQFEKSTRAKSDKVILGWLMTIGGGLFFWTGLGFFIMIAGIVMLTSNPHFDENSTKRQASQLLFETISETLGTSLINCDVEITAQLSTEF